MLFFTCFSNMLSPFSSVAGNLKVPDSETTQDKHLTIPITFFIRDYLAMAPTESVSCRCLQAVSSLPTIAEGR